MIDSTMNAEGTRCIYVALCVKNCSGVMSKHKTSKKEN